ncbi:MAG: hypothetical protein GF347_03735 [Candidatus Moranbacteria bacterium]|nr:hypothetical protein [Candidatus Moranbacteria bacterium]
MSIDDLNKDLYSRSGQAKSRLRKGSLVDPRIQREELSKEELMEKIKLKKGEEITRKQKKILLKILLALIILFGFLTGVYFLFLYLNSGFSKDNVVVSIDAPKAVNPGEKFDINVSFNNNNKKPFGNAKLKINYDSNLKIETSLIEPTHTDKNYLEFDIGEVEAFGIRDFSFEGTIVDKEKNSSYITADLEFSPNGEVLLTKSAHEGINILKTNIVFQFEATRQAASGDLIEYFIKVINNTEDTINGASVELGFPDTFQYSASEIAPANEGKNIYRLPTLLPREPFQFTISGTIQGSSNEAKKSRAKLIIGEGDSAKVVAEESVKIDITTSPLIVEQTISGTDNESVDPGGNIKVKIDFYNSSNITMRDVVLAVEIKGAAVDFDQVAVENDGDYSSRDKRIVWRGGNNPILKALKPQERGSVNYQVKILENLPSETSEDRNFEFTTIAQIDSPDVETPIGQNKLISSDLKKVKINSKVMFETFAFYNDNVIENKGPIPPRVKSTTTYTIHWKIKNINNDLNSVVVKTVLPDYVEWEDNIYPYSENEKISFNDRTKEVIWEVGKLPAFTGTQLEAREVVFQISLTPEEHHLGQTLNLTGQSNLTAKDVFTQKEYLLDNREKTTALQDDEGIDQEGGQVLDE